MNSRRKRLSRDLFSGRAPTLASSRARASFSRQDVFLSFHFYQHSTSKRPHWMSFDRPRNTFWQEKGFFKFSSKTKSANSGVLFLRQCLSQMWLFGWKTPSRLRFCLEMPPSALLIYIVPTCLCLNISTLLERGDWRIFKQRYVQASESPTEP